MRQSLKIIIFLSAILILFTGCEYELSGEFNQDIQKPTESHEGFITLSNDVDSIVIFEQTDIQYSVSTFGLQFNGIQLEYLDTKITDEFNSSGSFRIIPDFNNTGWFDLKASFYLGTGSGSIADKFKSENYVGTKTWKVCFLDLTKYDFQFQQHVNKDGFLELFWIKPSFLTGIKSAINVYSTIHPHITKITGDTTFFADSTYYGGNSTTYTLKLNINNKVFCEKTIYPDYPFPELKVTPFGLDSAIVSWSESPLKRYYKVYDNSGYQHYVYTGTQNSFKTAITPGVQLDIYLEVYPYDYKNNVYNRKTITTKYIKGDSANYEFHYSYVKDQFYIPSPNSISQLEKVDITTTGGNAYADEGIYKYELWGNHLGTRFVGFYSGDIHIFDANLREVKKITICNTNENYGGQMTTNDCFGYYYYSKSLYYIINVGDDLTWQQFSFKPFADDESPWGTIRLSLDGNYAFWRGSKYFIIYDISNHSEAKIVYQCSNTEIYHFIGNPLNFKEIIVSKTDKIEVRSIPDFQLIKQIDLPGIGYSTLINIDTYSNTMLAYSQKHYHVINLTNMKDLLKFGGSSTNYDPQYARLHRNIFFLHKTKTDLTNYLNK